MEVRADFARLGWSVAADVGGRLRYGDALALAASLASDPSSDLGAALAGMRYPASFAEVFAIQYMTGGKFPSPFPTERERARGTAFKATGEEAKTAAASMSPMFQDLY